MLPSTVRRVPAHTGRRQNRRIREAQRRNVAVRVRRSPRDIARRLRELDREWDIERALEANAAAVGLTGVALGVFVTRWFLVVPAVAAGFLLQHALQGWCPPLPVLRRLGFRTSREIDEERNALKAVRGDFRGIDRRSSPSVLAAARR